MSRFVYQGQFLLDESRTTVFDSNGNGSDYLGPSNARERWEISAISVSSNSSVNTPTVKFFRNSAVAQNFVTGSFAGSLDVDSAPQVTLRSGERLYATWEGGDVGATGTFRVSGKKVLI